MKLHQGAGRDPTYAPLYWFLMENQRGEQVMAEDVLSVWHAQEMCAIWTERVTGLPIDLDAWQPVSRHTPSEGRKIARARGIPQLYAPWDPFELVIKVREQVLTPVRKTSAPEDCP